MDVEEACARRPLVVRAALEPRQLLTVVRTVPLTTAMVILLLLATGAVRAVGAGVAVAWTSTNLVNLSAHPVAALLSSVFVLQGGLLPDLCVFAIGSAVLERAVGARRTVVIGLGAQVTATLLTEYGGALAARVHLIAAFPADRADVGVSYVMYAIVAAAVVCRTGRRRRLVALALWCSVLVPFLVAPGMTSTGHVLSVAIGAVLGRPRQRSDRDRRQSTAWLRALPRRARLLARPRVAGPLSPRPRCEHDPMSSGGPPRTGTPVFAGDLTLTGERTLPGIPDENYWLADS